MARRTSVSVSAVLFLVVSARAFAAQQAAAVAAGSTALLVPATVAEQPNGAHILRLNPTQQRAVDAFLHSHSGFNLASYQTLRLNESDATSGYQEWQQIIREQGATPQYPFAAWGDFNSDGLLDLALPFFSNRQVNKWGWRETAQPINQSPSTNVAPQTSEEKPSADSEPVIRVGNFHLVQGGVPWSLTYNVAGTYKLRAHSLKLSIESGSVRISDSRPADETNQLRGLRLGVCYSNPGSNGRWDVYPPKGPHAISAPLDNVVLKKGDNYNFPTLTVVIPLPDEPLPPNNWLCSSLESQIGGREIIGSYPAHDGNRPLVFSSRNDLTVRTPPADWEPKTDPVAVVSFAKVRTNGFFLSRDRVVSVISNKDGEQDLTDVRVIISVHRRLASDVFAERPEMTVPAKVLRKETGPAGSLIILLGVTTLPSARLAPLLLVPVSTDQHEHYVGYQRGGNYLEGKIGPESGVMVGTRKLAVIGPVMSSAGGPAPIHVSDCRDVLGMPVSDTASPFGYRKAGNAVGIIVGCSSDLDLQMVTASKISEMSAKVQSVANELDIRTADALLRRGNEVASEDAVVLVDKFANASVGNAYGVSWSDEAGNHGAVFSAANASRIEYPGKIPASGTLEFWINVASGYSYENYVFRRNSDSAMIFSTDVQGGDVTWPGTTKLFVSRNGDVSLTVAEYKYDKPPTSPLEAKGTSFRFGEWHAVGFSVGSMGQHIMVDGKVVASAPTRTQEMGCAGTHQLPVDIPTIGETASHFWAYHRYEGGFEGIVARFRTSVTQRDWYLARGVGD